MESIDVKLIKPNPYQSRESMDRESIRQLADEIKTQGYWEAGLRARKVDGHYQLVFGHRRFEALKLLGRKQIQVEVVDLDDSEMALQSLVENLQRQGLNDIEKANGIKRLMTLGSRLLTESKVAEMLGYPVSAIKEFLSVAELDEATKKAATHMPRTLINNARNVGGPEFVKMAAQEKLTRKEIREIGQAVARVPVYKRTKLEEKIKSGKLTKTAQVQREARKLAARPKSKEPPPDLHKVLVRYVVFMKQWRKELRAIEPYREYIDSDPDIADEFRKEVRGLIEDLQKLL